ncbi:expressed conserved protein [Echinococcus multilocularis]|uniref:Expressed conserved protein n=1 Tax=Echinococcus multilocularis TaxID=6211 RepID=A0A087W1M5_ECHMU|nr:expressed conserved protein [Echinococcus multilocularis]
MNGKGMQTKPQSMKCALSLPLVLVLVGFASAYTFLVPVEKSWRTGRLYVYYEGRKYYLTDDPTKRLIVFLVNDCIVTLNLEKSRRERYRNGDAICRNQFEQYGDDAWKSYVDEPLHLLLHLFTPNLRGLFDF